MSWPGGAFVEGTAFEAARAFFQRLDVSLELVDALAPREARGVVGGHLQPLHLEIGEELAGLRSRARGFAGRLVECVAQDDEVARADEHLFLELVHLRGEIVVIARAVDAALGADDRVEQDDRAEAAADAVEEGETEDLDGAAAGKGHSALGLYAPIEMSDSSIPGSPSFTLSPA